MSVTHVSTLWKMAESLSGDEIINRAKARLNSIKDDDFYYLEAYLNNMFYPKGTSSFSGRSEALQSQAVKYIEDSLKKAVASYNFGTNIAEGSSASDWKIELNNFESFQHKTKIQYGTIKNRYNKIKQLLSSDLIRDNEEAKAIFGDLEKLVYELEALGKTMQLPQNLTQDKSYLKIDRNNSDNAFAQLVDRLDSLYQQISYFASFPVPNYLSGTIFEKALQALSNLIKNSEEDNINDLKSQFQKSTLGSQVVSRGEIDVSIDWGGLTVEQKKTKKGELTTSYQITGDGGSSVTIDTVYDRKAGKVDVEFTLPAIQGFGGSNFRVSAKNWSKIDNKHDFGSTDLFGALTRSSDINSALAYGLTAGSVSPAVGAYKFAKACAIADMLMGYSQKEGYADTVVINDRANKEIKVYSIKTILDKVNLSTINIDGLSDRINNGLDYQKNIGSQNYLNKIVTSLKSYTLRISAPELLSNY